MSWNVRRRSRHWSKRASARTIASSAVRPGMIAVMDQRSSGRPSGRHELVVVAMDPVAEAPAGAGAGDGDRAHDLANLAAAAEEVAALAHPGAHMSRIAVELERPRIDHRPRGPGHWRFGGDDVQDVDPPGRSLDRLEAAVATAGVDLRHDGRDPDAHDLHRGGW